jgi:hypothetical protein
MNSRRLFIGDVHGCLLELEELVEMFAPQPGDEIYCVGDVINKGPSTLETLYFLKQQGIRSILGNHESYFLYIMEVPRNKWRPREKRFIEQFCGEEHEWACEIASWPLFLEWEDILLVHAGLQPGVEHPSQMDPAILLSVRTWDGKGVDMRSLHNPAWFEVTGHKKKVIFGHWAMKGLVDLPLTTGLDTGCVYGGRLTGYCPEETRFYSVQAKKQWVVV